MKILLLGEYSNLHNNLADGLRTLGHEVVLANDKDHWKKFHCDINLSRRFSTHHGIIGRLLNMLYLATFLVRLLIALPKMRDYDVVQIINPIFLPLKAERHFAIYRYLRRHNSLMVLGAMGDDYYFCHVMRNMSPLRYSDYNIGDEEHICSFAQWTYNDKVGTAKEKLCRMIATDCDLIVAGAYEYWLSYSMSTGNAGASFLPKLHFIPFPINTQCALTTANDDGKLKCFIGISRERSEFKGTDIMLRAAKELQQRYPDKMELRIANGVPFATYQHMMDTSDVLLDQIYSYSPGMNALLALSKGIIAVSGGEPEHYDLLGELSCRPIINVEPTYESVYSKLEWLILHPQEVQHLKAESLRYAERNHNHIMVAKRYVEVYEGKGNDN